MTPSRPYLLRGLNDWINENDFTPYVVVDASLPSVDVPRDFVSNGQIVLNISLSAVRDLHIGNDYLEFSARFGGVPRKVSVPMVAVLAIYAKENGQGMVFGSEPGSFVQSPEDEAQADSVESADSGKNKKGKPSLKVVK